MILAVQMFKRQFNPNRKLFNQILTLNLHQPDPTLTLPSLLFSVGDAIAAFAAQMLKGTVPPGVYFPEEVPGKQYREEILSDISADAIVYSIDGQETGHTYSL
jgi:hypothetical protein